MTYIPADVRRQVVERAKSCCEYCRLHEKDHYLTHEVDHIISEKHQGVTTIDNLCLRCFDCNRYKGSDVGSVDVDTGLFTALYNPRIMKWEDHFQLQGNQIAPLTAEGRVTVFLLRFNSNDRSIRRQGLIEIGRYPCPTKQP